MAITKHGKKWKTIVIPAEDYFTLKAVSALEMRKISQQWRVMSGDWLRSRYSAADLKKIQELAEELRLAQDGVEEQYISD